MNSPGPANSKPANNRVRNAAGIAAKGLGGLLSRTGGSSTPMPVDLRGGPPTRAEDALRLQFLFPMPEFIWHAEMLPPSAYRLRV